MEYKVSYYNIKVSEKEEYVFLWNTATGSLIKLEKEYYFLLNNEIEKLPLDIFEGLLKNGFVVDENIDEAKKIIFEGKLARFGKGNTLLFVIAPTFNCNYRCSYCFEEGIDRSLSMEYETMIDTYNFIIRTIERNANIKHLNIQWFGGEPLLKFDEVIKPLSLKLIDYCLKNKIEYKASIITNGVFLNNNIISQMVNDLKITKIQISFDGTEENYCRIRKTTSSSFNRVKDNLYSLSSYCYTNNINAKIHVRINIDKNNIDDAFKLARELKGDSRYTNNIFIYLGRIRGCEGAFSFKEFEDIQIQFSEEFDVHYGIKETKRIWCSQHSFNSYCVGPRGELYKCEHFFGNKDKEIGNVKDKVKYTNDLIDFIDKDVAIECKKCQLLPICMSGCPAERKDSDKSCQFTLKWCLYMMKKKIERRYSNGSVRKR